MTDDQLRALVRDAVARHAGGARLAHAARPDAGPAPPGVEPRPAGHASHYQYLALVNVGDACVIEPSVTCNHCGYCRSHGY